jgi:hypothetical protein
VPDAQVFLKVVKGSPDEIEIAAIVIAFMEMRRREAAYAHLGRQPAEATRWASWEQYKAPGAWSSTSVSGKRTQHATKDY